jgi:hypothetical protein
MKDIHSGHWELICSLSFDVKAEQQNVVWVNLVLKLKSKMLNVVKGFYFKFSFSLDKGGCKVISTHVRMWVHMFVSDVYVYDVYPHPGTHPVRHARSVVVIKVAASYSTVLACIIYLKWVVNHIAHNITRHGVRSRSILLQIVHRWGRKRIFSQARPACTV